MRTSFLSAISATTILIGAFMPTLAQAQSAEEGAKIFNQCRTCHQIGETAKNGVGPQLNGLFNDRKAGKAENYNYSAAYKTLDKVWSVENFTTYIKDPRAVTPGTKMVYPGLKDEAKIADLIAFLKQYDATGKKAP